MRRRMIDPSIWESESVMSLTPRQFKLYIYLISAADDEGRLRYSPSICGVRMSPLSPVPAEDVASDVAALQEVGLIQLYGNCEKYAAHPNWGNWQTLNRPAKSIYPEPPPMPEPTKKTLNKRVDPLNISTTPLIGDLPLEEKRREEKRRELVQAKTPARGKHSDADKALAQSVLDAMEAKHGAFANYAKEWTAGYKLVTLARARWPDSPGEFLAAAIGEFWRKRDGGWMSDKPFTPSMLCSLWEHVIEGLRDREPDAETLVAASVDWGKR